MGPGVNLWLLARRGDDDVSASEVHDGAEAALAYWLGFPPGVVPGIRVLDITASRTPLELGAPAAERRETLPGPVPTVAGSRPWFVRLTFLSKLARTDLPWPVISRDFLGPDYAPSNEADWLLLSAAAPRPATVDEERQAEKPGETVARKAGELAHEAADVAREAKKGVSTGVSIVVVLVAIALGLAALQYVQKATA